VRVWRVNARKIELDQVFLNSLLTQYKLNVIKNYTVKEMFTNSTIFILYQWNQFCVIEKSFHSKLNVTRTKLADDLMLRRHGRLERGTNFLLLTVTRVFELNASYFAQTCSWYVSSIQNNKNKNKIYIFFYYLISKNSLCEKAQK